QGQNQPRRDDFGLKIGKLSHRTSIKDGLGRHIGSCGPLNRNFLKQALKEQEQDYSQGKIPAPPVDETQDNTQAGALHKESSRSPLSKKGDRLE
ncbi:hypothetical protein ABKW14_07465, partial [Enterobacter roggenkampii]